MSEWRDLNFGDYANVINGYAFKSSNFLDAGTTETLPIIKIKNVANGNVHLNGAQHHVFDKSLSKYLVENKDVLIALTGNHPQAESQVVGIASRYKLDEKALLNQRVAKIVTKDESLLAQDFIYYFLIDKNTHQYLASQSSGSANQANISKADIEQIPISLPCPEEQKAIASVLSSLDDKIDLLHRQNTTLERMAKALFRQWFVEEARDDWVTTSLQEQTDVFRGLSYKGSGLCNESQGLPMHNLNSIYEGGGYKSAGMKFYSGEYKSRHLARPGDLIVANTEQGHEFRLIGYPAIIPANFGEYGLFSQHIYRLLPKQNSYLSSEFLYFLLMTPTVREQVIAATNGSTVNMLSIDGLQLPEFKLPPKDKLIDFTNTVKNFWLKKNNNLAQIRSLEKLRDNLLPKLMSGEIRVKNG